MRKSITKLLFQGLAAVLTVVAMTNVGTTSLFMMYEPKMPESVLNDNPSKNV